MNNLSILESKNNSWDLEPRIGVVAADDSGKGFASPVQAWDAHVYFNGDDQASVEEALTLRYETCIAFPDLTVNRALTAACGLAYRQRKALLQVEVSSVDTCVCPGC